MEALLQLPPVALLSVNYLLTRLFEFNPVELAKSVATLDTFALPPVVGQRTQQQLFVGIYAAHNEWYRQLLTCLISVLSPFSERG